MMQDLSPTYFFDLQAYQHASLFQSINYVWEALTKIDAYLASLTLGQIETTIPEGAFLIDRHLITIGKGTTIEPGAYIKGPCYIGSNCSIRHGAYIRGNVVTGNKCVIGHDTEIKQAILLDNAHAAHFAYVGDTILGNHVNLGAGTKCANLKLDNQQITLCGALGPVKTGLRKFGAILGDNTQIGCNTVTNPGTLMGKDVWCYPSINVGGMIPSHSVVKSEAKLIIKARTHQ